MTETNRRDKGALGPFMLRLFMLRLDFALAGATGQPEGQQSEELTEKESAAVESQILPPQLTLFILTKEEAHGVCAARLEKKTVGEGRHLLESR